MSGEGGSALALVLVFVLVLALSVWAMVGFGFAGVRTTVTERHLRAIQYAADGAIETQIKKLSGTVANGDCASALTSLAVEDPSFNIGRVNLTCTNAVTTSATNNTNNTPKNAILALGTGASDGINLSHPQEITGNVVSHQGISLSSATLTVHSGNVQAWASCPLASITVDPGKTKVCPTGPDTSSPDPAYAPRPPAAPLSVIPPSGFPSCTGSNKILKFFPGIYNNPGALNSLTGSGGCNKASVIWFQPGVYYFNFPTGSNANDSAWQIANNGGLVVVGGEQTGWYVGDNKVPNNLVVGSSCSTAANADGVEFIFGGASHIDMGGGGTMELCSWVRLDQPEIAVYQANSASPGYTAPTGCVIDPTSRCPFVGMGANNSTLFVHGTVYAPSGLLDLQVPNTAQSALVGRGVIAQAINISIPISNTNRSAISVPVDTCDCTVSYKEVVLVANVAGRDRLKVWVRFQGGVPTVMQWSVLR